MWSPNHSRSPRPSPYILRPVPIRRNLAAESTTTSTSIQSPSHNSLFSPTPSTSSRSISSTTHSPIQPQSPQFFTTNKSSPTPPNASSSSSPQTPNYSQGGFLMKPQLLKKSPFANFPAGIATNRPPAPTSSKLIQPSVTIAPLPKHQFEKWCTSIKTWSPTPPPTKTPTTTRPPSQTQPAPSPQPPSRILRSCFFSPPGTPYPTFGSLASFPNEQPLNLSQPVNYRPPLRAPSSSSTCSFSTPTPCSPTFPLDLTSPPPPTTPTQNYFNIPSTQSEPKSQPLFRLNPKDHSIVAVPPNDKLLIEATQQLDSMNLTKPTSNQNQPHPIHQQATISTNRHPAPGPSHQGNQHEAPSPITMAMETGNVSGGIFCSDDNKITLHYPKPQPKRPNQPPPPPPPPAPEPAPTSIQVIQECDPHPARQEFRGLSTRVIEGSFSDVLTDKLEENYMKCRSVVMSKEGYLITPLRFLTTLCDRMGINYHTETFQFEIESDANSNEKQFRTELFLGGFCGVAHAVSIGFSYQLAAAHVLERMRIHFKAIKQSKFALYPGSRYTRIGEKLERLCEKYELGEVQVAVKDRRRQTGGMRRWGGYRGGDLEVKWECSCFVKKLMATVLSDDQVFGSCLSMKEMYLNFVKTPEVPLVQLKDYFAIGVDCPMFKDIHCSLLLNRPSSEKYYWMEEYGVPITQMDSVLNDPRNNSGYLMSAPMAWKRRQNWRLADEAEDRFVRFREQIDEALEWMVGAFRKNNLLGGVRFRQNGGGGRRGGGEGQRRRNGCGVGVEGGGRNQSGAVVAMETAENEQVDPEDLEVEEIFHDAMEV